MSNAVPPVTRKEWQSELVLSGLTSQEHLTALSMSALLAIGRIKAARKNNMDAEYELKHVQQLRDDAHALRIKEDQYRQQAQNQKEQRRRSIQLLKQQEEKAIEMARQAAATTKAEQEKAIEMARQVAAAAKAAEDAVTTASAEEAEAARAANLAVHAAELASAAVTDAEERAERAAERAVRAEGLLASQESPSFALRRQATLALAERNKAAEAAAAWAAAQAEAGVKRREHTLKKEERKRLEAIVLKWSACPESKEVAAAALSGKMVEFFARRLKGRLGRANEGRMATLIQRKYRGRSKMLQHQIRASLLGRVPAKAAEVSSSRHRRACLTPLHNLATSQPPLDLSSSSPLLISRFTSPAGSTALQGLSPRRWARMCGSEPCTTHPTSGRRRTCSRP